MAVFPPPLKPGGTIGIVSPARRPEPSRIKRGAALLEKMGYRVVVHPQNYLKDGPFAGSDKARAVALTDMFADPAIDAIFCGRGGMGAIRMVDKLDYKKIARHPKPFVGYSDITVLLHAIQKKCGFVTYHGPMMGSFVRPHDARTIKDLFNAIGEHPEALRIKTDVVRKGAIEGHVVAGNMTLLQNLIGTPYDWSGKDAILFIEDIDEVSYKLDRTLHHFRLAGKLKGVRAVVVGEMLKLDNKIGNRPYGRTLRQIFEEVLPSDIPLCFDFPCGHGKYLTTLPVGARAQLTLDKNSAILKFRRV